MISKIKLRKMAVTAIMTAIASVLMLLEFGVPIVPGFLKFDFSDLPALIVSFSYGPFYGVLVCLLKNIIHLPFSSTAMAGELANFLIGASFVLPAGIIYRKIRTLKGALIGAGIGSVLMALLSIPINYYITYPVYVELFSNGDLQSIINMYTALYSGLDTLPKALVFCNMPFTFVKGVFNVILCMLLYKRISPILKGQNKIN